VSKSGKADTAGVLAPPPVIYLAGLLLGWGADRLLSLPPLPGLTGGPGPYLGSALGVAGLLLILAAAGLFLKAGTHIEPYRPSTALVTGGLYRYSRNPIYLGLTLVYLGLAAGFASLGMLALLPAVLLVMVRGVIRREERYLEGKFGAAYRDYKAQVRRWL
jgi:protein-S-isoprenylcysteine O-methyltransferase Ste14